MLTLILVSLSVALFAAFYFKGKHNEAYWKKRGVAFSPRNKAAGIFVDFFTSNRSLYEIVEDIYKKYPKEPAVGVGSFFSPELILRDPTNVQYVTSIEFNSFIERTDELSDNDLLAKNILFINGDKWKVLRQNLSPLFTSSRLKLMYYIMDKSAQDFIPYIKNNPKLKKGNAYDTLSIFCSAAIGAAVFGITTKSVFDSPFLIMSQKAVFTTFWQNFKAFIILSSSFLTKLFNVRLFSEHEKFFIGAIKQVIEERKKTRNIQRHDFGDLCVALQDKGVLRDDITGFEIIPTDEVLSAQAFFFFNAGVDPIASTMFNTFVLLGQHPEVQERLIKEVDDAFDKCEGKLNFDIINEMEYLDMVLNESQRLYPAIGFLTRRCVRDSTLPVGNITVEKGTRVYIPTYSLQRDEKYYPDPEVFNPERFSSKNKTPMIDKTYMPFGKGNRLCMGARYAPIQTKAGMAHLLRNFKVNTISVPGKKMGYKKDMLTVRLANVDVEFIER